jgi:hypothetical protein
LCFAVLAGLWMWHGRADAALKHRYSFGEGAAADASNRMIVDSVSNANGVVRGAGASATATELVLAGGSSQTQAYVDLPNGIVSSLTDATFEAWYTISSTQAWARVWDFGSTTADPSGELTAPGGTGNGSDNLFFSVARGTNLGQQRVGLGNEDARFGGSAAGTVMGGFFDMDTEFPHELNQQYHAVLVFNANGAGPGVATETFYINGVLAPDPEGAPNPFTVGHQLANLNDVNNWLGRSNWTGDANFGGSFNEFRIYDHALTATDVAQNSVLGPDTLSGETIFSVEVNTTTGATRLINNRAEALTFDYYEISSAGGALNAAGWAGVDGDTPSGQGWDKSGSAGANLLTELYLPENGYEFPANSSLPIGNALNPAVFGAGNPADLEFRFGLANGVFLIGPVNYVSTAHQVAGDYNQNGVVDAADYVVWRKNSGGTTLPNRGPGISGPVGTSDYEFWRSRFGATSGTGSGVAASVPEPSTLAIVLFGWMAARSGRRGAGFETANKSNRQERQGRQEQAPGINCISWRPWRLGG